MARPAFLSLLSAISLGCATSSEPSPSSARSSTNARLTATRDDTSTYFTMADGELHDNTRQLGLELRVVPTQNCKLRVEIINHDPYNSHLAIPIYLRYYYLWGRTSDGRIFVDEGHSAADPPAPMGSRLTSIKPGNTLCTEYRPSQTLIDKCSSYKVVVFDSVRDGHTHFGEQGESSHWVAVSSGWKHGE